MIGHRLHRRPRANRTIVALAMTILALTAAGSAVAAGRLNLLNVETQFMCVSCHEPLNTVSSPQAISEKQVVSRLIAKGDDMQQIKNTMVSYYGVQVLARPPASGVNLPDLHPAAGAVAGRRRFARLHAPTLAGARPPRRARRSRPAELHCRPSRPPGSTTS